MKSAADTADVYDTRTIALHWVTAVLVLTLWTIGQCIDFFPKGVPRMGARSTHITIGVLLALLLVVRIAWRVHSGVKLSAADAGILGRLAVGVHYLLYGLLLLVVMMGIASVWARGDTWFNWFTVPAFDPNNKKLAQEAVDLHGLAANTLLAVAGLHAAAAGYHHLALKDRVLRRMWPRLSRPSDRNQARTARKVPL
jgi:cytochrome b561